MNQNNHLMQRTVESKIKSSARAYMGGSIAKGFLICLGGWYHGSRLEVPSLVAGCCPWRFGGHAVE